MGLSFLRRSKKTGGKTQPETFVVFAFLFYFNQGDKKFIFVQKVFVLFYLNQEVKFVQKVCFWVLEQRKPLKLSMNNVEIHHCGFA